MKKTCLAKVYRGLYYPVSSYEGIINNKQLQGSLFNNEYFKESKAVFFRC